MHPTSNPDLPRTSPNPSSPGGGDEVAGHGGRRLNQRGGLS